MNDSSLPRFCTAMFTNKSTWSPTCLSVVISKHSDRPDYVLWVYSFYPLWIGWLCEFKDSLYDVGVHDDVRQWSGPRNVSDIVIISYTLHKEALIGLILELDKPLIFTWHIARFLSLWIGPGFNSTSPHSNSKSIDKRIVININHTLIAMEIPDVQNLHWLNRPIACL